MSTAVADHALLGELFGDAALARHLDAAAEIAAMIRFEAALAEMQGRLGIVPEAAGRSIAATLAETTVAPETLAPGTRAAGVPVPALVAHLRAAIGPPHGGYVHWGATSQDVMDTGLVLRLRDCLDLLEERLEVLLDRLSAAAEAHARLEMAARTRAQVATPTVLGLRIAGWRAPLARCQTRLAELRPRLLVVQLGGAAGTQSVFGAQGVALMEGLAHALGLGCPAKPWHAERDALVELANWLAMVTGLLGRIGGDLILLGRSEIGELAAGTGGGSSTMPQKANPVQAESLVALARQAGAQAGLAQQALLHQEERDSTAWALEWMVLPALLQAAGAALNHATALAGTLTPKPPRMAETLARGGGTVHAEALAFSLAGQIPLPEAQAMVKAAARAVSEHGGSLEAQLAEACRGRGLTAPSAPEGAAAEAAAPLIARSLAEGRGTET